MNGRDVAKRVSQKTGAAVNICVKVINAFEEQVGVAVINKFKGVANNRADIVVGIAEKTGISTESCDKILTALEEVLSGGLSDKLKFFQ